MPPVAPLLLLLLAVPGGPDDRPRRHGPGTPDAGLPLPTAVWRPYHADEGHALNRVFRRLFLVELVPAQVGEDLPRERPAGPPPEDWMLRWREGGSADARLFGGDGRQLPREGLDGEDADALRADLAALTSADVAALKDRPALAVLFQHDLLRAVRRLSDTGRNPELVAPLLDAARRVALAPEVLAALEPPPVSAGAETDAARAFAGRHDGFREVLRRSTRLFDASRTLLWSRVHLAHPDGPEALGAMLAAARGGADVEVPVGTRGLLVQGIVALDDDGEPRATPLVVDVRSQALTGREDSTSRDGVDFSILWLEREGVRRRGEEDVPAFRSVRDDDQDLFRDYGTLKHTTVRAQCALCHRTTRTPEPHLGGFPLLRPHAEPRLAATGEERLRLAEDEVREWLASLPGR